MKNKGKRLASGLLAVLMLLTLMPGAVALAEEDAPRTLTIAGNGDDPVMQGALEAFGQLYPEVDVVFAGSVIDKEKETYEQAVLSGSNACDIYLLSGNADLKGLIDRGLVAPLLDEVLQADETEFMRRDVHLECPSFFVTSDE